MDPTTLRARCEARLAGVRIPSPFDLAEFSAELGRRRGRPIRLVTMTMPADGPSGLCLCGESADYVVYEQATTRLHQMHIALHEMGHLLCEHEQGAASRDTHLDRLFEHLDPGLVRHMLGRTRYSTEDETEAEMLASLILQRADLGAGTQASDPAVAYTLRRLRSSL